VPVRTRATLHPSVGEEPDRSGHARRGGFLALIRQDLRVGEAGTIVDRGVDEVVAVASVALGAGDLRPSVDAPPSLERDPALLLDATGYKWIRRFTAEGHRGLHDRPSRPHRSPIRLSPHREAAIVARSNPALRLPSTPSIRVRAPAPRGADDRGR
jgi:hypothetical protein